VDEINRITERIIGAAIEIHRELGPGLLESAYEQCLVWELEAAGMHVERQVLIPITYKGKEVADAFRLDLLIEKQVLVELKSIDDFAPVHTAQVLTYLKLTGLKVGLILNFKVDVMRKGIRRVVSSR
jgi:GxxExxY protein